MRSATSSQMTPALHTGNPQVQRGDQSRQHDQRRNHQRPRAPFSHAAPSSDHAKGASRPSRRDLCCASSGTAQHQHPPICQRELHRCAAAETASRQPMINVLGTHAVSHAALINVAMPGSLVVRISGVGVANANCAPLLHQLFQHNVNRFCGRSYDMCHAIIRSRWRSSGNMYASSGASRAAWALLSPTQYHPHSAPLLYDAVDFSPQFMVTSLPLCPVAHSAPRAMLHNRSLPIARSCLQRTGRSPPRAASTCARTTPAAQSPPALASTAATSA